MNKKAFPVILLALAAGTFLGYAGRALVPGSPTTEKKQTGNAVAVRPRFGGTPASAPSAAARRTDSKDITELDDMLKRCMRLSSQELYDELASLCRRTDRNTYTESTARDILLSCICTRLGQEVPRQTLSRMKDNSELAAYQHSIIEAWGEKNPEAAMAYCLENMGENSTDDYTLAYQYVTILADSSPEKAIAYLSTRPPGECEENLSYPLSRLVKNNPEKMAETIEKLTPAMAKKKEIAKTIVRVWAQADWDAAERWIKTQPEENRSALLSESLIVLSREDAMKKLDMLDEKGRENVLAQMGQSLFSESPSKALEFFQANTTEEQAARIIENCYLSFNSHDAEFLSSLDKMPAGTFRDNMLARVINLQTPRNADDHFFDQKWEDTLSLAEKINSAEKKEEVFEHNLLRWIYKDPQKIKLWAETSQLSDDRKKEIIEHCNNTIDKND